MGRADFKHLKEEDIHQAMHQTPSDWGLRTDLDLRVFERLEVFVRGDVVRSRTRRRWSNLWRREEVPVPVYQRLVLALKLRKRPRLDLDLEPERVYFKVFKDIPKNDVDMMVPGGQPRMTRWDRAMILYPLATGVGLLLWHVTQNILESGAGALLSLSMASLGLAAAFGGYGYKSYNSYLVKRRNYVLQLVRSLYSRQLDSNTGVLMRLLDEAEEQECRETYLAYFCLWRFAPPEGWTSEQLDDYVELYLEGAAGLKVDFEIGAALAKLERLGLARKSGDHFTAVPLDKALEILDWKWDNYFKYNQNATEPPV